MAHDERLDMTLGEAMYSLRAIRRQKSDPIPNEDIRTILDAAIQAPNGGNMQPWHFLVVTDDGLRAEFAPLYTRHGGQNAPTRVGINPRIFRLRTKALCSSQTKSATRPR